MPVRLGGLLALIHTAPAVDLLTRGVVGPSDPGSWNRYAYVGGDPTNFNDPQGLIK